MAISSLRVAIRHIARGHDPEQVGLFTRNYLQKLHDFEEETKGAPPNDPQYRIQRHISNIHLQGAWKWLIRWGEQVATWVIETRAIPRGKAKAVEMACRLFIKAERPPRDVVAWWEANAKHAYLLRDATLWHERSVEIQEDGVQEKLVVGPFTVHNTLHLTGPKLVGVLDVLQKVEQKLKAASPPSLTKVLYGDVFVVGQLKQSRTLAWYFSQDDRVYLRPHLKVGFGDIHNLVHELGHRYWNKFLSTSGQKFWNTEYTVLKLGGGRVSMPKVGDPLGLPVRGHTDSDLIVVAIKPNLSGDLKYQLASGALISFKSLYQALKKQAVDAKFPTQYASTSSTEFWAETFAMHVLGTLPEEHEERFLKALQV